MIACQGCGSLIERPHVIDDKGRELCEECAKPVLCGLCDQPTPNDDRLPFLVERHGVKTMYRVHSACALRLTHALGYERAATLLRRQGPAFRGRS